MISHFLLTSYRNLFTTDARRDARKAFLAFSTGDVKSEIPNSEPFQEDDDIVSPQLAKGDVSSSQSTPVRIINGPIASSYWAVCGSRGLFCLIKDEKDNQAKQVKLSKPICKETKKRKEKKNNHTDDLFALYFELTAKGS